MCTLGHIPSFNLSSRFCVHVSLSLILITSVLSFTLPPRYFDVIEGALMLSNSINNNLLKIQYWTPVYLGSPYSNFGTIGPKSFVFTSTEIIYF